MRAGDLREVLHVEAETTTPLGGGASTTDWVRAGTVRGHVRVLKGREYLQARQVAGAGVYEVTVRYPYPDGPDGSPVALTSASRFVWEAAQGDVVLSCTEPPRIDPAPQPGAGSRFATVLCAAIGDPQP